MSNRNSSVQPSVQGWGGLPWTEDKLEILRRYLDAYTTALKHKDFALWYIDAFAGTGEISVSDSIAGQAANSMLCEIENEHASLDGSARIAANIQEKSFDKLIFIEKDAVSVGLLRRRFGSDDRIDIRRGEANEELQQICQETPWICTRAVVFLDPFGTQVQWETIEAIAETQCIDVWILFPTMAVRRLLPIDRLPDDEYQPRLNRIFGNSTWKECFYEKQQQLNLFGEVEVSHQSSQGTQVIVEYYREQMEKIFADVSDRKRLRYPGNNSVLFDLIFAVSNPNAKSLAMRIAKHILDKV